MAKSVAPQLQLFSDQPNLSNKYSYVLCTRRSTYGRYHEPMIRLSLMNKISQYQVQNSWPCNGVEFLYLWNHSPSVVYKQTSLLQFRSLTLHYYSTIMSTDPSTFRQQVSLQKISDDEFVSNCNPGKMGNLDDIAYGGCTIGVGINAAYQTVKSGYHVYSILGHYLGPAFTDRNYQIKITPIRDTRSFATRLVEVKQEHTGVPRTCSMFIMDFQTQEPASLLEYSATPSTNWPSAEASSHLEARMDELIAQGKMSSEVKDFRRILFGMMEKFFDGRSSLESVAAQNIYSMLSDLETTQDHLPLPEKTSGDWTRCKHPLLTEGEQIAALAFYMDGALSFLPLTHSHRSLADARTCSSLDFALRIMSNNVDFNKWHLREMKTIHGGEGRTYTEGRLWDEQGNMVASMTQQSILRPHRSKESL
jgi:acyl-CoA thioesterase II